MIDHPDPTTPKDVPKDAPTIVAVSINNTRTHVGLASTVGGQPEIERSRSVPHAEAAAAVGDLADDAEAVVLATVKPDVSGALRDELSRTLPRPVLEVHRDVGVDLKHTLSDASTLGQDRALNALAAFARVSQACVVIDAGTAITIDFVDGEGTFHGGMILPGAQMMLDALHERTAGLPGLSFGDLPDPLEPFGRETSGAIFQGVVAAARGSVRYAAERYAEFYGAFAQVIATGGDANALFGSDELVESIVPDLTLLGIAEAFRKSLAADDAGSDPSVGDGG
ncbi:MAG: type III pantothenate kinase [Planctomycetota bacterium]